MTHPSWSDPRWVGHTPYVTLVLLEGSRVAQLARMWREHTAAGQSILGWVLVTVSLALWWNFYRVCTPTQRSARWSAGFGVAMSLVGLATVVYLRWPR